MQICRRLLWTTLYVLPGFVLIVVVIALAQYVTGGKTETASATVNCGKFNVTGESLYEGDVFRGIPYGHREAFYRPVPFNKYAKNVDARAWQNACPLLSPNIAKQYCQYLNIYRCKKTPGSKPESVIVYLGTRENGFESTSELVGGYAIQKYACPARSIIVAVNYRTGGPGFFSANIKKSGNAALWDIKIALEWVQNHISFFGGDPSNVTILGVKTGANIASLLGRMPEMKHLFHKMILVSGSSHALGSVQSYEDAASASQIYAQDAGCLVNNTWTTENAGAIIECIRRLGWQRTSEVDRRHNSEVNRWPIVANGNLVPESFAEPSVGGQNVPTLFIDCQYSSFAAEKKFKLSEALDTLSSMPELNSTKTRLFKDYYAHMLSRTSHPSSTNDNVEEIYSKVKTNTNQLGPQLIEAYSTALNGQLTYFLQAIHQKNEISDPEYCLGIDLYVFPAVNFYASKPDDEYSKWIASVISNFVATSNPTPSPPAMPAVWPRFDVDNEQVVVWNQSLTTLRSVWQIETGTFWLCQALPWYFQSLVSPLWCKQMEY